jgi:transposase
MALACRSRGSNGWKDKWGFHSGGHAVGTRRTGAAVAKPAFDHLIWQAAQGEVLHNDDTGMRILQLAREPSDKRTGVFTSGIVSLWQDHKIALFFTGRQHAGENLADLLNHRAEQMSLPVQMCDALS